VRGVFRSPETETEKAQSPIVDRRVCDDDEAKQIPMGLDIQEIIDNVEDKRSSKILNNSSHVSH